MRTDTIFYQLFQTFPNLLFELIGQPPEQAQNYEFSSREVKELAYRFDGIFLPTSEATNVPIYFVEVQFQPKPNFYWRFFTEIFVYLGQYQPNNDWLAVAVFASRNLNPGVPMQYRWLGGTPPLYQIYLDELSSPTNPSFGVGIIQLVLEDEDTAAEQAKQLVEKTRQEVEDETFKQKVVQLIETVLIYKLPQLSREEVKAMFGLEDLKKTRYFQEVAAEAQMEGKLEGKLESVPGLLALGLSVEQIAGALKLDVERVREAASGQSVSDIQQDVGES